MINQVAITHANGKELTQDEITDVLRTLSETRRKGKLPHLKYEYRPPMRVISPRETLYILASDPFLYIQIQSVLDQDFPGEYTAGAI